MMLEPVLEKNDARARIIIITLSVVVFVAVVLLGRYKADVQLGFDEHIFATINAFINSAVAVLLLGGLISVNRKRFVVHKRIMLTAMVLSALFLVSYIGHHLFAGETKYGDVDHNGILSATEAAAIEGTKMIYYIILITHIFLAAIILPFILFTAYRALIAEWPGHRKLAKITWPIWFYVAVTGPIIYLMISPYY